MENWFLSTSGGGKGDNQTTAGFNPEQNTATSEKNTNFSFFWA